MVHFIGNPRRPVHHDAIAPLPRTLRIANKKTKGRPSALTRHTSSSIVSHMETVRNLVQSILPESLTNMSLTQKIETPTVTWEQPLGLYIDGKWVKGKEGKTFDTINPTNEKPIV